MLTVAPHPLLECAAFITDFPARLELCPSPGDLLALLDPDAPTPFQSDDEIRGAVRDLLRVGGVKPTGRSKPASEYLLRAVGEGVLGSINLAVDACNIASYHSGLPISVVDLDRATGPLRIEICDAKTSYIFNSSGQVIDVGGLVCVHDALGPCAGPVKDSQRTKTHEGTTRTLSVVWGTRALPGRADAVAAWYRSLFTPSGATTTAVDCG